MKTVYLNQFEGMADDKFAVSAGQFSVAKHFDTMTYPGRLVPKRALAADTTGTGISNLQVGSDGKMYGLGLHTGGTVSNSQGIWTKPDNASAWTESAVTAGFTSITPYFDLFVEYKKCWYTAYGGTTIAKNDYVSGVGNATHSLSFTNIAQGVVHPADDILYVPYDNKIAANNNGTWIDAALTLPDSMVITAIAPWGNYLAIAAVPVGALTTSANQGSVHSVVFLWGRDTSLSTVQEVIDWGTGVLRVLNNVNGYLSGISDVGGASANIADRDSISIKFYDGSVPQQIAELSTDKQTTSVPDASINPRVNFVYRGRHYFSINLMGGGASPSYYGLWALGKSKRTGRWGVTIEQSATIDDSDGAIIAAAITGDYTAMVNGSAGTLRFGVNSSDPATIYGATSSLETAVNPNMPEGDKPLSKQLVAMGVHYLPLGTSAQIGLQYRVDGGDWTDLAIDTTAEATAAETTVDVDSDAATSGRNYEFRTTSTGGGVITGLSYKYEILETNLT